MSDVSVRVLDPFFFPAGTPNLAGSTVSLPAELAAQLVTRRKAEYTDAPVQDSWRVPALFSRDQAGATQLVGPDGVVFALSEAVGEVLADPSATTQILTGAGEYFHYRCTVAEGTITIYDNTASSGKLIVPTTTLVVGAFPVFGEGIANSLQVANGIRVVLSGAATVYVGRLAY